MSNSLYHKVIDSITHSTPEQGYGFCFQELMKNSSDKEISLGLAVLSMAVGNHEAAEFYLKDSQEYYQGLNESFPFELLSQFNDLDSRSKWDNYRRPRNQEELKRMSETAPLCYGDVLEIGCANGDLSVFIACHGSNVYGIDIDPIAIDLARHKVSNLGIDTARFQVGNGYELQFDNDQFDTVVVAEVLEHVDNPKKIIQEAYRVCKPGGTIIISVPNGYSIPDPDHFNIFTRDILQGLVQFAINEKLYWNFNVPEQWILGSLIKPFGQYATSSHNLNSLFLPPAYSIPKSDELVSVIIPTYNRKEYINDAIQSILDQTHTNIEIIVVDDGSDELHSPKDSLAVFGDKIRYIYKENAGKSSALNEALQYINGEFVWVFDDDDIALPLKLELQLKRFQSNPEIDLVHTRSINFNTVNGQVISIHDLTPYMKKLNYRTLLKGCFVHGPTVLFRKRCLDKLEGWDPQLIRAQDYDFWLRLANHYKMDYLAVPTVRYRMHSGIRGSSANPVEFNEISSKTVKYEQIIFRKLYRTIPINELYSDIFKSDNVTLMLEAFIERATVFATRGLLDEVKQDILIVNNNAKAFGNPCFSAEAIQNIHKLSQFVIQIKSEDHELVSNIFQLVNLVTTKS